MTHARAFAFGLLASASLLAACDQYSYPIKEDTKDQMKAQERNYGDPDGPAKQIANKYEADPEVAAKAALLKEKLFNDQPSTMRTESNNPATALDTAAALQRSAE